jgi:RNA polymerase sigma factor (TIGR02999 family)
MAESAEITRLLRELQTGDRSAESTLIEALYPDLKRIAAGYLRNERRGHTLQPTALVNEAWLQLLGRPETKWKSRCQFFAIAALLMRHILVDHARKRKSLKREGGFRRVELTEAISISDDGLEQILLIDAALKRLAAWDPRQSRVVELRFFGGLSEDEVAQVLGVASRTVKRDWKVARAWLHGELNREPPRQGL